MKTILTLLFVITIIITNTAQTTWEWVNPLPQGHTLKSIWFTDANNGLAIGEYGAVVKTTNGGQTWEDMPKTVTVKLENLFAFDSNLIFAYGDSGTVIKTNDLGETWASLNVPSQGRINSLYFTSPQKGFACFDYNLFRTDNGGQSWEQCFESGDTILMAVRFKNNDTGYVYTSTSSNYESDIYFTFNGGLNWSLITQPVRLSKPFCLDSLYWFDYTSDSIRKSSDGGLSWDSYRSNLTSQYPNYCWHFLNKDTAFSYYNDYIMKTTDGGINWDTIHHCEQINLNYYSIFFTNNDTGYIVGDGGSIYITIAGGQTWLPSVTSVTFKNLKDICFKDSLTGFIGGNAFLKTTDGGVTWSHVSTEFTYVSSISFITHEIGFAIAINYTLPVLLLKTTDGGNNWNTIQTSINTMMYKLFFVNDLIGFMIGYNGAIYKTTSGGNTWVQQNAGVNDKLNDVYFVNATIGYICGDNGTLLKTTNGGNYWASIAPGFQESFYKILFTDNYNGILIGTPSSSPGGFSSTYIHRTIDGGISWDSLSYLPLFQMSSFMHHDNKYYLLGCGNNPFAFMAGYYPSSLLARGVNDNQWDTLVNFTYLFFDAAFSNSNKLIGIGYYGGILQCKIDEISINYSNKLTEKNIVFPNPVTNMLHFSLTENFNHLLIYNSLGEKIFETNTTVNEYSFSTMGLCNGIYFVVVKNQKGSCTLKFIK